MAPPPYHRCLFVVPGRSGGSTLGKHVEVTCEDCYFHKAGLCALLLESPCPTFRNAHRGVIVPPLQPQLVPRPLSAFAPQVAPA
jgi:hypothetical protein